MKILMVCLGNICRSPLADGLLRRKVSENQLDVEVDSAGTSNHHRGEAPDARMLATAKKNGTDLSFLRSRQFVKSDFQDFLFARSQLFQNFINMLFQHFA